MVSSEFNLQNNQRGNKMIKPILGIDVSKLHLSISLLIDSKYYQTEIANNQHGFKLLDKWLKTYEVTKIKACMESTGNYWKAFANYLHNNNHDVYVVNPSCINAFARSKLLRHKTDKVDSKIIAEYASKNDLQKFTPKNKIQQELQDLYRCLQNLKEHKKQTDNYLENKEHLPKSVCDSYKNIPGIGKLTAAAILAETPDLKSFANVRELAAYAGLTPKHKISGTSQLEGEVLYLK